jgi:hypothetical protein
MGAEFLVAILWGVVVVYWVWSRRPAFGDSIGLFRNELYALEHAAPTRVTPANRRRPLPYTVSAVGYPPVEAPDEPVASSEGPVPAGPGSLPAALAAAALSAKRLKVRRRRRDVLSVLLVAVVVSAVASVASRSVLALSLQALSDLVLGAYAYLLVTMTRASIARSAGPRLQLDAQAEAASPLPPPPEEDWVVDLVDLDRGAAAYAPAHAMGSTAGAVPGRREPVAARRGDIDVVRVHEAYGDFDSYASLALAQAN